MTSEAIWCCCSQPKRAERSPLFPRPVCCPGCYLKHSAQMRCASRTHPCRGRTQTHRACDKNPRQHCQPPIAHARQRSRRASAFSIHPNYRRLRSKNLLLGRPAKTVTGRNGSRARAKVAAENGAESAMYEASPLKKSPKRTCTAVAVEPKNREHFGCSIIFRKAFKSKPTRVSNSPKSRQ